MMARGVKVVQIFLRLAFLSVSPEVRLRMFFESAGGAFLKFGHFLSLREDVLPPSYARELLNLSSHVAPLPFPAMEQVFAEEKKVLPSEYFLSFNPIPIASAPMAQVYRAALKDGGEVAVKIQRPGLRAAYETDFRILSLFSGVSSFLRLPQHDLLRDAVRTYLARTRAEFDFLREARHAQRLFEHSAHYEHIAVPKVFLSDSSPRVLVTEYLAGITSVETILHAGWDAFDLQEAATMFVTDELRQYFVDGFFHAGPHPANLFFTPEGRLGYFDFGLMEEAGSARMSFVRMLEAMETRETEAVVAQFLESESHPVTETLALYRAHGGTLGEKEERVFGKIRELVSERLAAECQEILDPWYRGETKNSSLVFARLLEAARAFHVPVSEETVGFFHLLALLDHVASRISPTFNMMRAINHFFATFPAQEISALLTSQSAGALAAGGGELDMVEHSLEELAEFRRGQDERLLFVRERLADLVEYYSEKYEEIHILA